MAQPFRIFISSPGDVNPERLRAQLVIEKLAKNYARFFAIESILWEVEPMLATGHFQDHITPPGETDIMVLILWSRLGTPLPEKTATREYRGIDGRVPVTGTEWEFENALAAYERRGAPDLLAYRKQVDPTVSLKDKVAKAAAEEQWEKLDGFWSRWFVDRGQFLAAFSKFDSLDEFAAKLERDLKRLIEARVAAARSERAPSATWHQGSPFRGLASFCFEDAAIFFGRSAMTRAAVEQLAGNAERGRAFLLMLGASGSGKSSLAQAGLLPALTGRGIVPGVGLWRRAVMHPGGHAQGPFTALADALVGKTALPELSTGKQDAAELARHLKASAEHPAYPLAAALDRIEEERRARGGLLAIETARLALVVDQLEELFTAGELAADDRVAFIRCLDGLARSGRVYVVATMRSDYWHRAAETTLLVEMAAGFGRLDLLPPEPDEIFEMIRQPARAAGLAFETDPARGVGLDATIESDAQAEPGSLPLLSFLLDELYKRDIARGRGETLTFASMRELGGLKGAIAGRADTLMAGLSDEVRSELPRVLRSLITVSGPGAEATGRATPLEHFPGGSAARRLVDACLDPQIRLLVAEGDGVGARIRIAHEALLTHWDKAHALIARSRGDLELRSRLEQAAALWRKTGDDSRLLGEGTPLEEAEDLLARYPDEVAAEVEAYIRSSQAMWDIVNVGRPSKRDLRLDLFMGLALWFIFLDHVSGSILSWTTIHNYGFSDATEIFVFISGYFAASQYAPAMREAGLAATAHQILKRAFKAYVAYIFLFELYLAEVSYVAETFDNPLYSEEIGALNFLKDPGVALIQAVLLKYAPANMDVLQIYIILMTALPPVLWLLLRRPTLALSVSVLIYMVTWKDDWAMPAYPDGRWPLNPTAWQLIFVFGAWCATGGGASVARLIRSWWVIGIATIYLAFSFAISLMLKDPGHAALIPSALSDWMLPIDKTNFDVLRSSHFLALAALATWLVPRDWPRLKTRLLRPAILCGQRPLEMVCLGVLLSFAGHFVLVEVSDEVIMQVLVGLVGIAVMIAAADVMTFSEHWRLPRRAAQG